jgi:formate hydrogenlyase subunit 4
MQRAAGKGIQEEVRVLPIIAAATAPLIALLVEGAHRKLLARSHGRRGPPLLQPFYDVAKLLAKKPLRSQNDAFFKNAPYLYFAATFALFAFVPFQLVSFRFDFLFVIYVTILSNAFYVLSGTSSDNPFGIISSAREITLMICYEMTLAVCIFSFMMAAGTVTFAGYPGNVLLSIPVAALCLMMAVFAELQVTPFDTAEAPSEVMMGVQAEYGGRQLAFLEVARYMKRLFFVVLCGVLFVGTSDLVLFAGACAAIFLVFTVLQASRSRYRVDQAFRIYFATLVAALAQFVLVARGFI